MSSNRRFEYDKGPSLEDERPSAEDEGEADRNDGGNGTDGDGPTGSERPIAAVAPWKAGAVAGAGAFAIAVGVLYHLVATMDAVGRYGQAGPGRLVMTGLSTLANHGATIERGGEPIETAIAATGIGLATQLTALVPAVVLLAAGYLLGRHVRLETRRDGALAVGALVLTYTASTVALGAIARWTPGDPSRPDQAETIAAALDLATVVSIGRTALVFAGIGGIVATLPQLLEAGPIDLVDDGD
ncbi:hypothetical protein [Natrinema salifodinae]|uniref:DUF7978 domain-containing protein n=1 Tax=Natrinema salifodinae TaxID=1202768 RepID=A0A1I0QIE1_9EURY|nr:hypothetical protein [Natrinema salifodinae]SEW26943.1 hypothetical protein SAMN05216285_3629 [Natrinema salifodinae]